MCVCGGGGGVWQWYSSCEPRTSQGSGWDPCCLTATCAEPRAFWAQPSCFFSPTRTNNGCYEYWPVLSSAFELGVRLHMVACTKSQGMNEVQKSPVYKQVSLSCIATVAGCFFLHSPNWRACCALRRSLCCPGGEAGRTSR